MSAILPPGRACFPHPRPNHALQRTEAGGGASSEIHVLFRQPPSLSLDSLGHQIMTANTSTFLWFGCLAAGILILRVLYFRLVPHRRTRFGVQAVLYPLIACITVFRACRAQVSLSWPEIAIIVLCLLATIEAIWRRRTSYPKPQA